MQFFGVCVEKFATIDHIIFSFFSLSVTLLAPFLRYLFFLLTGEFRAVLQSKAERDKIEAQLSNLGLVHYVSENIVQPVETIFLKQMLFEAIFCFTFFRFLN